MGRESNGKQAVKKALQDFFHSLSGVTISSRRCFSLRPAGQAVSYTHLDVYKRQELEGDRGYAAVLACGPRPMLRNVARAAEDFGVRCLVSMEERMGLSLIHI